MISCYNLKTECSFTLLVFHFIYFFKTALSDDGFVVFRNTYLNGIPNCIVMCLWYVVGLFVKKLTLKAFNFQII